MESDELIVQSQHWPDGSIIKKHKITVLFTSSSIEKKAIFPCVTTHNVNERIFTGICNEFSSMTEANCSYRPPMRSKNKNKDINLCKVIETGRRITSTCSTYQGFSLNECLSPFLHPTPPSARKCIFIKLSELNVKITPHHCTFPTFLIKRHINC
jgi:hypothetical protein